MDEGKAVTFLQMASQIVEQTKSRVRNLVWDVSMAVLDFFEPARVPRTGMVIFGPEEIPPKTTKSIAVQSQVPFRCTKIINSGDREGLYIHGLYVGNKAQLPTVQNSISVNLLSPDFSCNLDTCHPALFITWQIENSSEEPRMFSVAMLGEIVTGRRERW